MRLTVQDFYNTFFKKSSIPSVYNKVVYSQNNATFYETEEENSFEYESLVYFIKLFPNYLNVKTIDASNYIINKAPQNNLDGFGILIKDEESIESYMLNNFKSTTRSPIKRRLKRLESCFSIHHKFYYGETVEQKEYDKIMEALKHMLTRRFAQKKDINEALTKWENYNKNTKAQVLAKEASIYIMYANEDIIAVSLNYHIKDILIGHILTYDIDYSKFSLGNTMIYKLLDWCIQNNYSILDMGNGEMEYKNVWCNFKYNYEYHFIYKKKSINAFITAHFQKLKISFKNVMKSLKLVDTFRKIKTSVLGKNIPIVTNPVAAYTVEKISKENINKQELSKIKYADCAAFGIKKTICDFLFLSKEHFNDIKIYSSNSNYFIVEGKNNIIRVNTDNR